jgi:hypothetical protein
MITENERGQHVDEHHYELTGHPMRVRWKRDRVARFIECYHTFSDEYTHENLHNDLME